jgi:hypothetical protein
MVVNLIYYVLKPLNLVNEKILLVILVVMYDKFRVTFEYGVAFATHYRFSGLISII